MSRRCGDGRSNGYTSRIMYTGSSTEHSLSNLGSGLLTDAQEVNFKEKKGSENLRGSTGKRKLVLFVETLTQYFSTVFTLSGLFDSISKLKDCSPRNCTTIFDDTQPGPHPAVHEKASRSPHCWFLDQEIFEHAIRSESLYWQMDKCEGAFQIIMNQVETVTDQQLLQIITTQWWELICSSAF